MNITPAILVSNFSELEKQLKKIKNIFKNVQLDIMDGVFVDNKSFNFNESKDLSDYFKELNIDTKFELHLMVKNPLEEIEKWKKVKNIFRVIFHIESDNDPNKVITKIKKYDWQTGIAINPTTELDKILPFINDIEVLQFMTVIPGKQGNLFVKEVGEKIQEISKLKDKPLIAVDGGVNENNILLIKNWGTDIFNIGSALIGSDNIKEMHDKLNNLIK